MLCLYEGKYFLTGVLWSENVCNEHGSEGSIVAKVLQPNRKGKAQPTEQAAMFTDIAKFLPYIYGVIYDIEYL